MQFAFTNENEFKVIMFDIYLYLNTYLKHTTDILYKLQKNHTKQTNKKKHN